MYPLAPAPHKTVNQISTMHIIVIEELTSMISGWSPASSSTLAICGSTQEPDEPYFFVPDKEHFLHPAATLASPQKLSFIARTDSGIFNP
jgi:hypothetical protein